MATAKRILSCTFLTGLIALTSACVIHDHRDDGYREGYREGYFDRDNHRYWHENAWHECIENDPYCR